MDRCRRTDTIDVYVQQTTWAALPPCQPIPPFLNDSTIRVHDPPHTGGKWTLTQWVHCEFVVSFEAIRPVVTQQVCGEFF